jgi:hypothetical protein
VPALRPSGDFPTPCALALLLHSALGVSTKIGALVMLENLSQVAAVDPAATGRAPEMLGPVLRLVADALSIFCRAKCRSSRLVLHHRRFPRSPCP